MGERDMQSCMAERSEQIAHTSVYFRLFSFVTDAYAQVPAYPRYVSPKWVSPKISLLTHTLSLPINLSCQHSIIGTCRHEVFAPNLKPPTPDAAWVDELKDVQLVGHIISKVSWDRLKRGMSLDQKTYLDLVRQGQVLFCSFSFFQICFL